MLQSPVQLVELILGLQDPLQLLIRLLLLALVLSLKYLVLALGFDAVPLDDVVVVVGALEGGLHLGELVLHSIKLDTGVFARFAHFAHFLLFFTEL